MWSVFLVCCFVGLAMTLYQNLSNDRGRTLLLRASQERKYGGILFYFVATSVTYAAIFFGLFFLANLAFGWV